MKIMHLSCNIAPIPRTISYGIIHMISPIGHNNVPKGAIFHYFFHFHSQGPISKGLGGKSHILGLDHNILHN